MNLGLNSDHVGKKLMDLAGLPFKLLVVGKMLILAPATSPEVRTVGFDSIGRGLKNLDQIGVRTIAFVPPDPGPDLFTRESEWDENDPAIGFGDAGPEI